MVRGADFVRSSARDSVEGEIARAQAIAIEAEVRLSELARQPAESLIDAYRQQQGLDLLGEPVWSRDANSVAVCTVDDVPYVGINSQALTYTNADRSAAEQLRDVMLEKYPDTMSTESVGQFPNEPCFMQKSRAC